MEDDFRGRDLCKNFKHTDVHKPVWSKSDSLLPDIVQYNLHLGSPSLSFELARCTVYMNSCEAVG